MKFFLSHINIPSYSVQISVQRVEAIVVINILQLSMQSSSGFLSNLCETCFNLTPCSGSLFFHLLLWLQLCLKEPNFSSAGFSMLSRKHVLRSCCWIKILLGWVYHEKQPHFPSFWSEEDLYRLLSHYHHSVEVITHIFSDLIIICHLTRLLAQLWHRI